MKTRSYIHAINTYAEKVNKFNKNIPTVRFNRSEKACKYIWEFNRVEKKLPLEFNRGIKKFRSINKRQRANSQDLRQMFLKG